MSPVKPKHIPIFLNKCEKCPYFTKSPFSMRIHTRDHEIRREKFDCGRSLREFSCTLCQKTHFSDCHKGHKRPRKQANLKLYQCEKCSFQTWSQLLWNKHEEIVGHAIEISEEETKEMDGKKKKNGVIQDPEMVKESPDKFGLFWVNDSTIIVKNPTDDKHMLLMTENERYLKKVAQQLTSSYVGFTPNVGKTSRDVSKHFDKCEVPNKKRKGSYPSKKNRCPYCQAAYSKLSKHLPSMHKNKTEVKELLQFPIGSAQRAKILANLRKKGNFLYNSRNSPGEIYLVRKPHNKTVDRTNYKPCPSCQGYYSINSLRKHFSKCGVPKKGKRTLLVESRRLEKKIHPSANSILRRVFPVMREDQVCEAIRYDELAILVGNQLCNDHPQNYDYHIRTKLRLLGKFLLEIRKISNVGDLRDVFRVDRFEEVMQAVKVVAKFDEVKGRFELTGRVYMLGGLLRGCAEVLVGVCVKTRDGDGAKDTLGFLRLLDGEFKGKLSWKK